MIEKKVVLIAPSPYELSIDTNAKHFVSLPSMPLAIVALGSFLQKNGVPVELIDIQMDFGFGLTEAAEQEIIRLVVAHLCRESEDIQWIGVSCLAHSHARNGLLLSEQIKAALPDIPVIFGGYFPSGYSRFLLRDYHFIDGIVYGDGEVPALEISRHLAQKHTLRTAELPNWICRSENGELIKSDRLPQLNPDTLPTLDFTLLRYYKKYSIASMLTSRGCPFRCKYCVEPSMRSYRSIGLTKLAQELSLFDRVLPCEHMFVFDPIFGLGKQRTTELARLFQQTKFAFVLESRADVLDPGLIVELKKAGVECISLGLESASLSTLLRMGKIKRRSQYERYLNRTKMILAECFRHNVTAFMGIMLGYPGDRQEDTQATLDFLHSLAELHDEKRRETGHAPGFVAFPNYVMVYPSAAMSEDLRDYPETSFRKDKFYGEYLVTSPSPGYTFSELGDHFGAVEETSIYTPVTEERFVRYVGFCLEPFLADHPDLVTNDVVVWKDAVQGCLDDGSSLVRYSPIRWR